MNKIIISLSFFLVLIHSSISHAGPAIYYSSDCGGHCGNGTCTKAANDYYACEPN